MKTFIAVVASSFMIVSSGALAGEILFPKPLHLTRKIDDPISRTSTTLDEYYMGNRAVTVAKNRVVIVDYERQEVTEIDRAAATYSISRFDEVARARAALIPKSKSSASTAKQLSTPLGAHASAAGRNADAFEIRNDATHESTQISIDRTVALTRASLDVLLGAAYPGTPAASHDAILSAAANAAAHPRTQTNGAAAADDTTYGLPADQTTTYDFEGSKIVVTTKVTHVGDEVVAPDLLMIPPGATRVESRTTALPRVLDELDRRPAARRQ
jgi:hypothetical protein